MRHRWWLGPHSGIESLWNLPFVLLSLLYHYVLVPSQDIVTIHISLPFDLWAVPYNQIITMLSPLKLEA
jgi:hypothetical protein